MLKRTLLLLLVSLLMAAPLMGADTRRELVSQGTLEQIVEKNRMRVGFSTFVPWAMKDKQGGYTGYEIEVARQLAKDMGVEIDFVPTKWSGIIPALLTGKFDIIIGGMGITPERNLKVNFSDPYEYSGMSIIANRKLAGMKLTAAAMVSSQPFPEFQALKYPERLFLPLQGKTFTREPIGFAIRKGDVDFLNFLNNWIRVKNADNWLQERYDYWFTTQEWKDQVE